MYQNLETNPSDTTIIPWCSILTSQEILRTR